eukprot:GHRR01028101.1.p1 GENE.GHRR01028101.1~~GHRR01028101.1.p1  ORF type:complete len:155 (-),score=21.29 GHRR01028101.1:424-888(-)
MRLMACKPMTHSVKAQHECSHWLQALTSSTVGTHFSSQQTITPPHLSQTLRYDPCSLRQILKPGSALEFDAADLPQVPQYHTSLQHNMTPSTFVSTIASKSSSSLSSRGPYLYAFVPALLILQATDISNSSTTSSTGPCKQVNKQPDTDNNLNG